MSDSVMEARKRTVERFWQRVENLIGLVPMRAKALLDLFGLTASIALGDTKRVWTKLIEEEIQKHGDSMFEEARSEGFTYSRQEVFGSQQNMLEKYELRPALASSIESVQKLIQEEGIRALIAESPVAQSRRRQAGAGAGAGANEASEEFKKPLLEQIANYYETHPGLGIRSSVFANLSVSILSESGTDAAARVPCVKCRRMIKCTRSDNNWLTGNYYQHVRLHRRQLAVSGEDRVDALRTPVRRPRNRTSIGTRSGMTAKRRRGTRRSILRRSVTNARNSNAESIASDQDETLDEAEVSGENVVSPALPPSSDLQVVVPINCEAQANEVPVEAGCSLGQRSGGKSVSDLIAQFTGEGTSSTSFDPQGRSKANKTPRHH